MFSIMRTLILFEIAQGAISVFSVGKWLVSLGKLKGFQMLSERKEQETIKCLQLGTRETPDRREVLKLYVHVTQRPRNLQERSLTLAALCQERDLANWESTGQNWKNAQILLVKYNSEPMKQPVDFIRRRTSRPQIEQFRPEQSQPSPKSAAATVGDLWEFALLWFASSSYLLAFGLHLLFIRLVQK